MFANTSKQLFVSNGSIIAGEPMDPWGYLLDIEEVHGCNFVFFFSQLLALFAMSMDQVTPEMVLNS